MRAMRKFAALAAVLTLVGLAWPAPIPEKPAVDPKQDKFIATDSKGGVTTALKTASVTYQHPTTKVTVDLVGVIHIGDRGYYRDLNRQLAGYDATLYELVAPPGTRPEKQRQNLLAIAAKMFLDLDHQLGRINYKAANFVHADLSPEEMKQVMAQRGDDTTTLALRVLADVIQKQNQVRNNPLEAMVAAELATASGPVDMKRAFARMFDKQFNGGGGIGLPALEQVLIKDRNAAAIRVMEREIKAGKSRLAIFYGAGHCADLQERLLAMGYTRRGVAWNTAWDLTDEE